MTISREAIEAAARALDPGLNWDNGRAPGRFKKFALKSAEKALTAALPHLAPAPSLVDEERAEEIARAFTPVDMGGTVKARAERILTFASAVRAEERERAAKWHDDRTRQTPDVFEQEFHEVSAAAIRAGVTADEWVALPTRKP